ncbi:MAG TPA: DUF975 domain-containing protein [Nostocaceae cyanobacterium]|nr:DUF975 domain-containing protein [Nostocaceae cyanobacterium]
MSGSSGSPGHSQPLSVGNVVSAGLKLYRSHLKEYFLIALKAYAWLIVPIYGWAKCYALIALISRLAFGDLVNQPESVKSGERFVNSRLWQFLLLFIILLLMIIGLYIGIVLVFVFLGFVFIGIFGRDGEPNPGLIALLVLLGFLIFIPVFIGLLWLFTHFYLVDVPLAIEEDVNATSTISRSWELTQGHVWRVLGISFVAALVTFPIQFVVQTVTNIIQLILESLISRDSSIYGSSVAIITVVLSFLAGAAIVPISQTVKAVIYYDLRSRREGLGLQLRDREI